MSQIYAIAWVRLRLLINSLRQHSGGWERVVGGLALLLGLMLSAGLALLFSALTHSLADVDEGPSSIHNALLMCFWGLTFLGLFLPVLLSTGTGALDTSRLAIFPIRQRRLFLISWGSTFLSGDHLFYLPMLLATLWVVISLGFSGGAGGLLCYWLMPLVVITWSMGVLELLQAVMRHRRGKEIAGMVGFGVFLALAMIPTVVFQDLDREPVMLVNGVNIMPVPAMDARLVALLDFTAVTPPGLAADGMQAFALGETQTGVLRIAGLLLWALGGLGFSYLVFRWRQLGNGLRSQSGGNKPRGIASRFDATSIFPFLSAPTLGVASKELRYIFRSSVGKLNILLVPVVCAFLLTALGQAKSLLPALPSESSDSFLLYGLMLYGLLFTNNFTSNAVGWEGSGFKLYLLAPVPFQRVLVGKNLGIWTYSALLYVLILGSWSVIRGIPSAGLVLTSAGFFAGSMLIFSASGNLASLAFPVRRDISAMQSQPSQPALLLSLLTVLCLGGALGFLVLLMILFPRIFHPALVTGIFVLAAALVYRLSLPHAEALFQRKRDEILAKAEGAT